MRTVEGYELLIVFAVVLSMSGCQGDFGDAPDGAATGYPPPFAQTGQFPTLSASGGAVTEDVSEATLGPTASIEQDANDPSDPDGQPNLAPVNTDSDDGLVDFNLLLTSIPPPAVMSVDVNGPAGSAGGTFWINVLIDLNMDGEWGGVLAPGVVEWAVINFPVVVGPGVSTPIRLPAFAYANGNRLPDGAWMRIALTDEMIVDPNWDGGGSYDAGEIEDHVIDLPQINGKTVVPRMDCPRMIPLPGNIVQFGCTVTNWGPDAGTVTFTLRRLSQQTQVSIPPAQCPGAGARRGPAPQPNDPAIRCGPVPIAAAGALGATLNLNFTGIRNNSNLPSRWEYRVAAVDPISQVTPEGIILGFGDSVGDFDFVGEPIEDPAGEAGEEGLLDGERSPN